MNSADQLWAFMVMGISSSVLFFLLAKMQKNKKRRILQQYDQDQILDIGEQRVMSCFFSCRKKILVTPGVIHVLELSGVGGLSFITAKFWKSKNELGNKVLLENWTFEKNILTLAGKIHFIRKTWKILGVEENDFKRIDGLLRDGTTR